MKSVPRTAYWLAFLIPTCLIAGALIGQYGFGLFPCEMCMWQRWPHYAAICVAVLTIAARKMPIARILCGVAAVLILISGLIGGFHAGVEYGWWEGLTSCATNLGTGNDIMGSIMNAPLVRCDVAPWDLFGVSLAGFNFIFSVGGAILIFMALRKKRKGNSFG